jgi:isopentenyl diphosphate isomerase/L-lactate dehydrogenase-like FMN-dependent dehydrogenase
MSRRGAIERVVNVEEMRRLARHLPRPVFDVIDGGAGDELTLRANRSAYQRIWFRPRALADVGEPELSTTALGREIALPVMLAPCGFARLAHRDAEFAVARAAARAGTIFAVSTYASQPLETIAAASAGPLWYQLYLPDDRGVAGELISRAQAAGYAALCVTVDQATWSNRERDVRNKVSIPLRLSPRLVASAIRSPAWTRDFLREAVGRGKEDEVFSLGHLAATMIANRGVTAEDIEWIREQWSGPLAVKGITRGDESRTLIGLGVDAVVVSNHGGRQLDGCRPSIESLPEVVDAIGADAEIYLDGGIWRGIDIAKALALGARACLIGRAYMYGLAAGGEQGVTRVLEMLRVELQKAMAQLGCHTVSDFDRSLVCDSPTGTRASDLTDFVTGA